MNATAPPGTRRYKVSFVAPTCYYFQADIFRELAADPRIDLTVYFCSDEGITGQDVLRNFKTNESWGVENRLLEGYRHKFLRNYSPRPSHFKWPYGLMNFGVWNEIRRERPDAVVLMAWTNPTWYVAIAACLASEIPYFYMTDTNGQCEPEHTTWKVWAKRLLLERGIFRHASGFLCAGEANKLLYQYYGVPDEKLVTFAFSWHYKELPRVARELKPQRRRLRAQLGISEDAYVILYCGRLSKGKNPDHLLEAFNEAGSTHTALIFVGDGELNESLQKYAAEHNLHSVYFYGYQDRNNLAKFYAVSDVLVVPSTREATSMVTHEAMCFGLPVIASDQVGFAKEFVLHGYNGFIYPVGQVDALAGYLSQIVAMPPEEKSEMGARSLDLITKWLERDLAEILVSYLKTLGSIPYEKKG